jgi:hypothetical protein
MVLGEVKEIVETLQKPMCVKIQRRILNIIHWAFNKSYQTRKKSADIYTLLLMPFYAHMFK